MAASWEILAQRKVLVAILHTETVTVGWALGLRNLQVPGHVLVLSGMPYDHARNAACEHALREGYESVFMLDSDVIPPPDAILRLMAHKTDIVSGVYCRRSPPHGVVVAIKDGQWVSRYPEPGENPVIEVDLVGAGCLLMSRRFLENMPPLRPGKRWFDWRVDMAGHLPPDMPCLSEDFCLMHHARVAGYKVLLDTSVRCKHVGLAEAGLGSFLPLNHQQ